MGITLKVLKYYCEILGGITFAFSALTLLLGRQDGHLDLSDEVLAWLFV